MTDTGHLVERTASRWGLAAVAAVVVLLVVAIGLGRRTPDTDAAPDTTVAPTTTTAPTTAATTTSTTVTIERGTERLAPAWPTAPGLSLTPGARPPDGRLALAPWPDGERPDDEAMWVIDGGRSIGRFDLRTHPGDWPFPILFNGDRVVFVDEVGNVQLMDADGTGTTTLKLDEPIRYLVPASTPGEVWAVHDDLDLTLLGPDGSTSRWLTDDTVRWVELGVADGVMVSTFLEPSLPTHLPRSTADHRALASLTDPQTTLLAAAGDLIAVFEPGPRVTVIDVRADERVVEIPLDRTVTRACFSADGSQLAVGDFTGEGPISIVDLATGERFERYPSEHFGDMAWASETELVVLDGNRLVRFDADGGGETIGLVTGPTWRSGTSATAWWIASERAPC